MERVTNKEYSELDMISTGVYGAQPVMDVSRTCYSKQSVFLNKNSASLFSNSEFKKKLDQYSGCNLPESLKAGICRLLDDHSINSSLSMSMDITSLANISSDLKKYFSTLLEHAYSVDSRTQQLVLSILELISDACPCDRNVNTNGTEENDQVSTHLTCSANANLQEAATDVPNAAASGTERHGSTTFASPFSYESPIGTQLPPNNNYKVEMPQGVQQHTSILRQVYHESASNESDKQPPNGRRNNPTSTKMSSDDAQIGNPKVDNSEILKNRDAGFNSATSSNFTMPSSGYPAKCFAAIVANKCRSRMDSIKDFISETDIAKVRNPLCDLTNDLDTPSSKKAKSVSFVLQEHERDVIK